MSRDKDYRYVRVGLGQLTLEFESAYAR